MTTNYRSDRYELPFPDIETIRPRCPGCGTEHLIKVRPTVAVPFEIDCECGETWTVDPAAEVRRT